MKPKRDPLYAIHKEQAARRRLPPLPPRQFVFRLQGQSDTDLTQLLARRKSLSVDVYVRSLPRFKVGRLAITPDALKGVPPEEVLLAVARHAKGDWGLLQSRHRRRNEKALRVGGLLMSEYLSSTGRRFRITTEAARELTTVALRGES